jgi:O-antigen ligase
MLQQNVSHDWWRPSQASESGGNQGAAVDRRPFAFWALMGFTAVLLLSPQSFFPVLSHFHLAFATAMAAGITLVAGRLLERRPVIEFTPETVLVLCIVAWAVATIPLSLWPGGAIAFMMQIFIKAVIVFWLLGNIIDRVNRLWLASWSLSLMTIPLSLSAVHDFFSGGFHGEELSRGLDRIAGYDSALTGNPNDLALMLNLILPITIALLFTSKRPSARYLLGAMIALDAMAVVATYSRAGFLALGVIAICYLVVMFRRGRYAGALLICAGMLLSAPLLPSSYLGRLGTIVNVQADSTGSAQTRLQDMKAAARYVAENPLVGAGIGQDILALNEMRGDTWTKVHNVYLEYAVDLGLPGLLLFILLLGWILRSTVRAVRRTVAGEEGARLRLLAEGIWISLITFTVAAFFYPDAYQFYFYYIAGLAVAARSISDRMQLSAHEHQVSGTTAAS